MLRAWTTPRAALRDLRDGPVARRGIAAPAADPDRHRWNGASTSSGEPGRVYRRTDPDGSQPDAWRYVVEVQGAGLPADVSGYR